MPEIVKKKRTPFQKKKNKTKQQQREAIETLAKLLLFSS